METLPTPQNIVNPSGQLPEANHHERQSGEGHCVPNGDETIREAKLAVSNIIPKLRVNEQEIAASVANADECPGGAGWLPPLSNELSRDFVSLYPTLDSLTRASRP
jgi:hypothetical protein